MRYAECCGALMLFIFLFILPPPKHSVFSFCSGSCRSYKGVISHHRLVMRLAVLGSVLCVNTICIADAPLPILRHSGGVCTIIKQRICWWSTSPSSCIHLVCGYRGALHVHARCVIALRHHSILAGAAVAGVPPPERALLSSILCTSVYHM